MTKINTRYPFRSHLFTVRVWQEALGDGKAEWRGKLQQVPSDEAHYFRDWSTLIDLLVNMLRSSEIEREQQNARTKGFTQ